MSNDSAGRRIFLNPVISRTIAAIGGGYLLANMFSIILAWLWPGDRENAVLLASQVSFLIYAIVVVGVFAVRSEKAAWLVIGIPFSILLLTMLWLLPEGVL